MARSAYQFFRLPWSRRWGSLHASVFAASDLTRLRDALERGGAVFIGEDNSGGLGVRLKFNAKDVRAINRMEGEGGPVGTDDV